MIDFAGRLLAWFDVHGRHDLPWQRDPDAYSVWVSEIMLQQTQVTTVIPYYERFIARFPDVESLAAANTDEVLALWSGLGYYARARNLHRAAREVCEHHAGEFPQSLEELMALPGIGRSTAGAVLALADDEPHPILDGNVKRVLARFHAVDGWPGKTAVNRTLWELAANHTPVERVADYTQAIMDLGATLCTRRRPRCENCPLAEHCEAKLAGLQERLPAPRPKRERPRKSVRMLVVRDSAGAVLLVRRPPAGIWGGLYSLPELDEEETPADWGEQNFGIRLERVHALESIPHSFTHFDLDINPLLVDLDAAPRTARDRGDWLWYRAAARAPVGMPAPVESLLGSLDDDVR